MKARKLSKMVPNLIGDGEYNQRYGSDSVSMNLFNQISPTETGFLRYDEKGG